MHQQKRAVVQVVELGNRTTKVGGFTKQKQKVRGQWRSKREEEDHDTNRFTGLLIGVRLELEKGGA